MSDDVISDELERRLAATLDRSLDRLDGETAARLTQARRRALRQRSAALVGLALAASVAALLLVPRLLPPDPLPPDPLTPEQLVSVAPQQLLPLPEEYAHLEVDLDLLADWELLEAIGERPDAS